jgi:hypothetical protein
LLPIDVNQRIADLHIQIAGQSGLQVTTNGESDRAAEHLETRTYTSNLGPAAADGHRIGKGWVARVPVTFTPTHPWDIGGVRYPL